MRAIVVAVFVVSACVRSYLREPRYRPSTPAGETCFRACEDVYYQCGPRYSCRAVVEECLQRCHASHGGLYLPRCAVTVSRVESDEEAERRCPVAAPWQ